MAETELWLVNLDAAASALEAIEEMTPRLSGDVVRRLADMRNEAARRERRNAHIALRILIERIHGPGSRRAPFERSATGKPSLPVDGLAFSLSHTVGLALIAVSDRRGPLGVDIERLRPVTMPDARRAPIEEEAVALAAGVAVAGPSPDARFLRAWVRIEAAAKAQGHGIGQILERLRPDRQGAAERMARETLAIVVHDIPVGEDVFAAIAVEKDQSPPRLSRFPATAEAIAALLTAGAGTRR